MLDLLERLGLDFDGLDSGQSLRLHSASTASASLACRSAIAAGYGASAPLTGEVPLHRKEIIIFTIAAGFSGVIAGIAIGVYLVAGWVD